MPRSPASLPSEPPGPEALRAAALAYLGRFAATQASLTRVLLRKVDRWQAAAGGEKERAEELAAAARTAVEAIVRQLVATGTVSDAQFAETRARALRRSGRSRRAVSAHLSARGVAQSLASAALPDDQGHELAAALIHARKRRLGPWRKDRASPEDVRRELGSLARAGFPASVALEALRYSRDAAEGVIAAFRAAL